MADAVLFYEQLEPQEALGNKSKLIAKQSKC